MKCPDCGSKFDESGLLRCPTCGTEIAAEPQSQASIDPPLVEVARGVGFEEVQMLKSLLEGSGIEVLLAGHTLHGATHLEDPMGVTRFLVKQSDAEAANELIAQATSEDFELGISDEELEAQALAAGGVEEEEEDEEL